MNTGEIVLYQPDNTVQLEVLVEDETVWLNQAQMVILFQRDVSVISRHIRNVFKEKELPMEGNLHFLQIANSDRPVAFYNLDVIISVGYRVKSNRGTEFRKWATRTLKNYLLHGYAVTQRIERLEQKVEKHDKQIGFFVHASLPPVEGVFYDGQIFDAYVFASNLIKSAKTSIVLIDNYVDESVLTLLSKRMEGVSARVITRRISEALQLDLDKHNRQYEPIVMEENHHYHDRFLIIDNTVYHLGASLKDLGKKLFAFSKMNATADEILV